MLRNPEGSGALSHWKANGDAEAGRSVDGNPGLLVRYDGFLSQDVPLPSGSGGKHAVVVGRASAERVNEDGDQTGLPYLYGYMVNRQDDHKLDAYLNDDTMKAAPKKADDWVPVWGIFPVPESSGALRLSSRSPTDVKRRTAPRPASTTSRCISSIPAHRPRRSWNGSKRAAFNSPVTDDSARCHAFLAVYPCEEPSMLNPASMQATHFQPPSGNRVKVVHKIACELEAPAILDERQSFVTTREGYDVHLTALDRRGDPKWDQVLPPTERLLRIERDRTRLYVQTDRALLAYDARSGKLRGSLEFDHENIARRLTPKPGGGVFFAAEGVLHVFDRDLKPLREPQRLGFHPLQMALRQDGGLLLTADGYPGSVLLLDADGGTVLRSASVVSGSVVADGDGITFLEKKDEFRREVVCHNPAMRFSADRDTSVALPLPDGRVLLVEDADDGDVEVCNDRGWPKLSLGFPPGGRLRHLCLNADGQTAYAVVSFTKGHAESQTVFRLDLREPEPLPFPLSMNPFLASVPRPEPLYESGFDWPFSIPMALDDGRIVILARDGARVLDAQGKEQARYADYGALSEALGKVGVVSRRIPVGVSRDAVPATLGAHLEAAARAFKMQVPSAELTDAPSVGRDGSLQFTYTVPAEEVQAAIGARAISPEDKSHMVLRDRLEFPFGDGASLALEGTHAQLLEGAKITRAADLESPILAALPLLSEHGHYAAVGSNEGMVAWLDGTRPSENVAPAFAMDEPVIDIDLMAENRVLAVGGNGGYLVLQPPMRAKEALRDVPRATATEAGRIVDGETQVIIGGVTVPKRV